MYRRWNFQDYGGGRIKKILPYMTFITFIAYFAVIRTEGTTLRATDTDLVI